MAVGTGGREGAIPPIFSQPKKLKNLKITKQKSVHSNKAKLSPYFSEYWKSQIYSSTKLYPCEMEV